MIQSRRGVTVLMLLSAGGVLMMSNDESRGAPARDEFAADRPAPPRPAAFSPTQAMRYLEQLCDIGPRISGSAGMKKQQTLLAKHFEACGAKVDWQRFTAKQKSQKDPVAMANLLARWHPDRQRRVILCADYDTRPLADREPDPRKWTQPFLGANDGASGVALLMELANHMKDLPVTVGVDFVLFDGEEFTFKREDEYFFGSKHFAKRYREAKGRPTYYAAILLDMIGGKKAKFPVEHNSWFNAGALVQEVWKIGEELKCEAFQMREGHGVQDDHIALNRAGIPAIDIIDFSYPHWHRLSDVPANCSGESFEQVAMVLSVWLQRTK